MSYRPISAIILPLLLIISIAMTSCSDDEPVVTDNIVGTWLLQYPDGLQTEGFIEWSFGSSGELRIQVYDVFSGDSFTTYDYALSEEKKSITISGEITNSKGETVYDTFAIYDIVKLTKTELHLMQSWVNTGYNHLEPENMNAFLLGGYKDASFKRGSQI